jgi:hypothetical protein
MELITNNKDLILKWYLKQARKDNIKPIELPYDFDLNCLVKTQYVKTDTIKDVNDMKIGVDLPQKLKIIPFLIKNNCHYNSNKLCQIVNKKQKRLKHILGYNFCSCPCNKFYSLEIHSVVQDIKSNEYLDFTEDFAGETEKWFIPVRELDNDNFIDIIHDIKEEGLEFYYNTETEHKCKIPNGKIIGWRSDKNVKRMVNKNDFINAVNLIK